MDGKQIALLIARHNNPRVKVGLTWESYIYAKIADGGLCFTECVEIAHAVSLSPKVQAEIEIRLYERIGNKIIIERATARYEEMFADRRGV